MKKLPRAGAQVCSYIKLRRDLLMGVLLYAQPKDKVGGVGTYDKRKRHPLD
jgi:hypothetical protein